MRHKREPRGTWDATHPVRIMLSARRRLLCVFSALAVFGCLSPTLPLPPPGEPTVTRIDEGLVRLEGTAPNGALMTAYNRDLGEGRIQDVREGHYDLEVPAEEGHTLILWYTLHGEESLPLEILVRER